MAVTAYVECPRCHAGMASTDLHCPACGTPRGATTAATAGAAAHVRTAAPSSDERRPIVDNPYAVLAAVFLAMAALGIPLIWMCRAWSPFTKTVLTLITLAYTALLFWLVWLVLVWSWGQISGAL